ncbi:alpha-E domain-containing protein [Paludibacterium denitrificans]|uniref:alpha-E domain-containing protein n=1 Tax=Paludibacterium denitrificans TaxID=2675226 RepID=UPI0024780377|nr:alpha-E domain-containing protein [Paludibacterium denitrificans]
MTRAILQGVSGCAGSNGGLAHHLAALAQAATPIRDRLSLSHSQLIQSASQRFTPAIRQRVQQGQYRIGEARRELAQLAVELTAIRGEQADHMTRDDGWQLLSLGRQLERLHTLASTLGLFFAETGDLTAAAFDLLLAFFDSTLTYRSYYQRRQDVLALLDLLVCDRANPRSLTSVLQRLQQALQALPGPHPAVQPPPKPSCPNWKSCANATTTVSDQHCYSSPPRWKRPRYSYRMKSACATSTPLRITPSRCRPRLQGKR